MAKHLVLMFAYHYPPENVIGAARPFRFSKYLSRLGYTCRVFTAADQTGREDPNTEFVPDPFCADRRRKLRWQVERAVRKILLPGVLGLQWSYLACDAARRYLQKQSNTSVTLFSTFPPLGSHLAAWQLAQWKDFPWIADFRDPMRNETLHKSLNLLQRSVDRWLEHALIRRADAIIANTDAALARWRKRFPHQGRKSHLIWNGFDPEERVSPLPTALGNRRVVSHVGELYGAREGRTATPVLESVQRLIAANRLPVRDVLVRLIGPAEKETLPEPNFLDRAKAEGWMEANFREVPKSEALKIARSSHYLLLLLPESVSRVPAKLFEYLQIGRPILAFVQPSSPAERLLQQSGIPYRCVYPGSNPAAIDETVAEFFTLPSIAVRPNSWFEEQFNAENQTRMLDAIIRAVHQQPLQGVNPQCHISKK
jgi:glycosyltransferase involved in cell wall biosynthesis